MLEPRLVLACAVSATVTASMIVIMCRLAGPCGMVDRPGGRKTHAGEIPLIGGLAILTGLLASLPLLSIPLGLQLHLVATAAILSLAGAVDDRFGMGARSRLALEVCAAAWMIVAGAPHIACLGRVGDAVVHTGDLGVPLTIIAVVGLVNAFNMLDGIDGLAAALALVAIGAMIVYADGNVAMVHILLVLAAGILPFLLANLGVFRQRIFLGDAGSMLIGYLIAWALIAVSQATPRDVSLPAAAWCVALPAFDTLAVVYRRMRSGRSPFAADRSHIHHLLLAAGLGPRQTLLVLVVLASAFAATGYALRHLAPGSSLLALAASALAYVGARKLACRALARRAQTRQVNAPILRPLEPE
ncbi:MraY family glycosyltransferase [Luteibacter sp. NPDC031894]|uniref:MraY family glycosyltransferase n=1 Tax=Luteibacter sp. NPDC031894 TaxID=3390572 RepID=UPI003D05BD58